jgi:hypothetical protein
MKTHRREYLVLAAMVWSAAVAFAQDRSAESVPLEAPLPAVTVPAEDGRRCLIICGLPGDADHRKLFGDTLELLHAGLTKYHGFAPQNVTILWGDKPTEKESAKVRDMRKAEQALNNHRASMGEPLEAPAPLVVASRETIPQAVEALRTTLGPDDALWVFVLGHVHYDGKYSWLNVAGDDLHQLEFGRLFEGLRCREQAFFITTAASGFYLKPLAAHGRVVISATEPDLELNETLFPHKLAQALGSPPSSAEFDMDGDGRITLLDLYLRTARETAQDYVSGQLLATEHALIDDDGDGRGTEVQIDYLPEELGGRRRVGSKVVVSPKGDGALAARIMLRHPPSPPVSDAKNETP